MKKGDTYLIGGVRRAVQALGVENEEDYDDESSSSGAVDLIE